MDFVETEEVEAAEEAETQTTPTLPTTTPDREVKIPSIINFKIEIPTSTTQIKVDRQATENFLWETKSAREPTKGQPGLKHII